MLKYLNNTVNNSDNIDELSKETITESLNIIVKKTVENLSKLCPFVGGLIDTYITYSIEFTEDIY